MGFNVFLCEIQYVNDGARVPCSFVVNSIQSVTYLELSQSAWPSLAVRIAIVCTVLLLCYGVFLEFLCSKLGSSTTELARATIDVYLCR